MPTSRNLALALAPLALFALASCGGGGGALPGAGAKAPLGAVLAEGLADASGQPVGAETYGGKLVGVYFSAHWCPPCRAFTPELVKFRDAHAAEFEVLFVSADHSAGEQKEYMDSTGMKWPVAKFKGPAGQGLARALGVESIPALVVMNEDGVVVTTAGREDLSADPVAALAKWKRHAPAKGVINNRLRRSAPARWHNASEVVSN
ncbi:MAG: thioredoxin-like domain-containing protein [Planctomycetota bacterium]|nr:thioredoxin-like domain-containing protein [Planctomycetota bacterium]